MYMMQVVVRVDMKYIAIANYSHKYELSSKISNNLSSRNVCLPWSWSTF